MKTPGKNILTLALCLLLALGPLYGCGAKSDAGTTAPEPSESAAATSPPTEPTSQPPAQPELADYSSDSALLIESIEQTHPIFSLNAIPDSYEAARDEYTEVCTHEMTRDAFLLCTQKYLASLGDGHMGRGFQQQDSYMDISWTALDGKLLILDENGAPTDVAVTHIGGVETRNVMGIVDEYFSAENDAARELFYSALCRAEQVLGLAGCEYSGGQIKLALSNDSELACTFTAQDYYSVLGYKDPQYIIRTEMLGDVFYIDLRSFTDVPAVDAACRQIEQAVAEGCVKFIIDVRGNGGGNSTVGGKLLRALSMTEPSYGAHIRGSALANAQRGENDQGFANYSPSLDNAVQNENITLLVLTDALTFSSATMLGVWVQDGRLGKIIGQTSSNAPNAYGDMLSLVLPKSGLTVSISYKQFLRPDEAADPDSLIPDIAVPLGQDILLAALNYMAENG